MNKHDQKHHTCLPKSKPSDDPHHKKINERSAVTSSISNFIIYIKKIQLIKKS